MGFGMLAVATPLGTINFPVMPGVECRGSAVVDPDGAVKIHIIVEPVGREPRRHMVYRLLAADPSFSGVLTTLELLRDDGEFNL